MTQQNIRAPESAADTETIVKEWRFQWSRHPMNGESMSRESYLSLWDRGARSYNASRYSEITESVIGCMEEKGLLGGTLIDIGCGIGAYAVPFSSRCEKVVAVDSSREALSVLKETCQDRHIGNIRTEECDCLSIPEELGCDTAFCSLCPGMNSPEAVLSMESLGVRRVYISSCDSGEDSIEMEIWRELGCDYSYRGYDTDYPFRFLRSIGRTPEVHHFSQLNESENDAESVIDGYRRTIANYRKLTDREIGAIERVVRRHSENGTVRSSRTMNLGMIIW